MPAAMNKYDVDDLSPSIVRNNNKCVLCRRCVAACGAVQGIGVIGPVYRGFNTAIESPWNMPLVRHGLHQLRTVYRGLPHGCAA